VLRGLRNHCCYGYHARSAIPLDTVRYCRDLHAGAHAGEQQERGVEDPQGWILVAEAEPKGRATNPRKGMDRACRSHASSQCARTWRSAARRGTWCRGTRRSISSGPRGRAALRTRAPAVPLHWLQLSVDRHRWHRRCTVAEMSAVLSVHCGMRVGGSVIPGGALQTVGRPSEDRSYMSHIGCMLEVPSRC